LWRRGPVDPDGNTTEDLLAYRRQRDTARREKLAELTKISEELPGGYT
jgi:hypothetical protein